MSPEITNANRHILVIVKVILALALFFLFYLLLFVISAGILAVSLYGGAYIIATVKLFGLFIGLLVMLAGVMIFTFTIKFLFKRYRNESPLRVQIYPEEHPKLFKLIYEVADAVGTAYPGKVYLNPYNNAGVIYNSSFRSLFLPVRKNLEIGCALINSMNISELRAILAHEFGHFSQKSTQLNSYLYVVNHVIHDLVYERDRWDHLIEIWAESNTIVLLAGKFLLLTVKMIRGILRKSYDLLLIPYMEYSREMEYHADAIAAEVAGKSNTISALRRTVFGKVATDKTFESLNKLAEEKKISENFYQNHAHYILNMAKYFRLELENELPVLTGTEIKKILVESRVNYKDLWVSHPSQDEREKNIQKVNAIDLVPETTRCWDLLEDDIQWQKKLTKIIYELSFESLEEYEIISHDIYLEFRKKVRSKYFIDEIFMEFYKNRFLYTIDPVQPNPLPASYDLVMEFQSIYSMESKIKFEKNYFDINDLAVLYHIKNKQIRTKYFEFDSIKYHRRDIGQVITRFEQEIEAINQECDELDKRAFLFNLTVAEKNSEKSKQEYLYHWNFLSNLKNTYDQHCGFHNKVLNLSHEIRKKPPSEYKLSYITREFSELEIAYKDFLKQSKISAFENITVAKKEILEEYIHDKKFFTRLATFEEDGIIQLLDFMVENLSLISDRYEMKVKELTDFQKKMYIELKII